MSCCKPIFAASLPDYHEPSDRHHYEQHVCFWSEYPKKEYGDSVSPDKQHPWRDHNVYRTLSDANTNEADVKHSSLHVHKRENLFHHVDKLVVDLLKSDLLRTMEIGMPDHLKKWIVHLTNTHKWLEKYNAIWLSMSASHDLTTKRSSYEEESRWNVKEMKEMNWLLLGVETQTLRHGSPTRHIIFNHTNHCSRVFS